MPVSPTKNTLIEYFSNSPEETFEIGKKIGKNLVHGSVIALNGDLGAGKTYLTKGIAEELEINEIITSPTYTIINEYEKRDQGSGVRDQGTTLYHIDTYRLNNEKEFEDIGGIEILSSNGITIIEWADKIKNLLPKNIITVNIEITGSETRKITIQGIDIL